jgi:cytochrome c-type biogenesis protein CcsB
MEIFELGIKLLDSSAYVYGLACIAYFIYIWSVEGPREKILRESAKWLVLMAFTLHTSGLLCRWYMGGFSRPPWTNLYESLVAFAWGASLIQVFVILVWRVTVVGAFSVPLIATLMTMGLLTTNKELEPLIPALQSHWLKIHVAFAILAYASFTVSACLAILYLIRRGVSFSKIAALICWILVFNLSIAGGRDAYKKGGFYMARTVERTLPGGKVVQTKDSFQEEEGSPVITRVEKVPYATIPYWLSLLGFLSTGFILWFTRRREKRIAASDDHEEITPAHAYKRGSDISVLGNRALKLSLAFFYLFMTTSVVGIQMSEAITLRSNPYLFFLLIMSLFFVSTFGMIYFRYENFLKKLPTAARLHELSYVGVLFGFPFQTLLLITGAIWAYYAWGRSWGWDPKETWAFITWITFLIYLHGKLLMRWKGTTLSVLSIIGFIILCFAFLGVNLVLSGLHSYGAA